MSLYENASPNAAGFRDVSNQQLGSLAPGEAVRLIDVREADEWGGELGRIPGASLVPLATIGQVSAGWPKDVPIVLICRSGGRSGKAALLLHGLGFSQVMNLVGGMLAWNEAKLPVERAT